MLNLNLNDIEKKDLEIKIGNSLGVDIELLNEDSKIRVPNDYVCKNTPNLTLTPSQLFMIVDKLNITVPEAVIKYCDVFALPNGIPLLSIKKSFICLFYNKDKGCILEDCKPLACKLKSVSKIGSIANENNAEYLFVAKGFKPTKDYKVTQLKDFLNEIDFYNHKDDFYKELFKLTNMTNNNLVGYIAENFKEVPKDELSECIVAIQTLFIDTMYGNYKTGDTVDIAGRMESFITKLSLILKEAKSK